jgi:phosphoinositide-3-kinase regulatory subunit 4
MITLDPSERPTFDTLLHTSRGSVFPETFYSFLYNYVSSINELSSESLAVSNRTGTPIHGHSSIPSTVSSNLRPASSNLNPGSEVKSDLLPSDSDHRLERIWSDYESIEPYILPESAPAPDMDVKVEYMPTLNPPSSKPFQVCQTYNPIPAVLTAAFLGYPAC